MKHLKDQNVKIELALVLVMYIYIVIVDLKKANTNIEIAILATVSEELRVYVNSVYELHLCLL